MILIKVIWLYDYLLLLETRVTVMLNRAYHSVLFNDYSYCGREFQDESETSCCRKKKFFQNKCGRVKDTGKQFNGPPTG